MKKVSNLWKQSLDFMLWNNFPLPRFKCINAACQAKEKNKLNAWYLRALDNSHIFNNKINNFEVSKAILARNLISFSNYFGGLNANNYQSLV